MSVAPAAATLDAGPTASMRSPFTRTAQPSCIVSPSQTRAGCSTVTCAGTLSRDLWAAVPPPIDRVVTSRPAATATRLIMAGIIVIIIYFLVGPPPLDAVAYAPELDSAADPLSQRPQLLMPLV